MTWVLFFLLVNGSSGLFYGGEYATQKQCEAMAHRVDIMTNTNHHRDVSLPYICVQKPEVGGK